MKYLAKIKRNGKEIDYQYIDAYFVSSAKRGTSIYIKRYSNLEGCEVEVYQRSYKNPVATGTIITVSGKQKISWNA